MNQLEVANAPLLFAIAQTQVTPVPEPAARLAALLALAALGGLRAKHGPGLQRVARGGPVSR